MSAITGIHHITAIGTKPQPLVDFYTQVLGLRLVKQSVNQDDVSAYHLFFGDSTGEPGMDLTFFTFDPVWQGARGVGQVTKVSLAVPVSSLPFWQNRFDEYEVKREEIKMLFGVKRLVFYDQDQQRLELVGVEEEPLRTMASDVWVTKEVSKKKAVVSFYSARLTVASFDLIEPILSDVFEYTLVDENEHMKQFKVVNQERAARLEIEEKPLLGRGVNAAGTVHHIAFGVENEQQQLELREQVMSLGLYPTEVIDRYYFKSVYFRTPAGILFEIATAGPGFTADEKESELGQKLALPPFLEARREEIESGLEPIEVRNGW